MRLIAPSPVQTQACDPNRRLKRSHQYQDVRPSAGQPATCPPKAMASPPFRFQVVAARHAATRSAQVRPSLSYSRHGQAVCRRKRPTTKPGGAFCRNSLNAYSFSGCLLYGEASEGHSTDHASSASPCEAMFSKTEFAPQLAPDNPFEDTLFVGASFSCDAFRTYQHEHRG